MKFPILLTVIFLFTVNVLFAQLSLFQLLTPKETNLVFSNDISENENQNVLAYEYFYNGAGVAVGDINNDGLEDIYFTANIKPNKLFLNLGGMKFKDITKQVGEGLEGRKGGWKTGVTMADVNGDGLLDIYVCYSGKVSDDERRNQLFINQGISPKGEVSFKEQAKQYGLDDKSYSTQAVFFDYDNDGDLDMFLLNHSVKKIDNMEFARLKNEVDETAGDKLYRNDHNHFTDVSRQAGIKQNPMNFGLGVTVADINKDGWMDIYASNDYNEPDYLYINNHDGTFSDNASTYLTYLSQFSMGLDIADFNNDALPDIITLDMLPEDNRRQKLLQLQENYESFELMQNQGLHKQYMRNMLHLNNGDGTFSEIGRLAGISSTDWSWTPLLADFDNDGYKDLFISNGYLRDYTNKDFLRYWGDYKLKKAIDKEPALLMDLIKAMPSTLVPNYIFKNNHDLTFTNKQQDWGISKPAISSGSVYADLDNDGDLDLVVNNINENASVYKNQSREQNNSSYLSIKLKSTTANTHAIGAKLYLYNNGNVQYEELNPGRGYLSAVSSIVHFGLPDKKIDSLVVIWPGEKKQVLLNIAPNQLLNIEQSSSAKNYSAGEIKSRTLFNSDSTIIKSKNEALSINDFKRQPLMLFMYSKPGPVIARADVNKDGTEDVFISGDLDNPAKIFIQKAGKFKELDGATFGNENESTIAAAQFFDANGDGSPDLYIAKGGYAVWQPNTSSLQDELYLNDGKGNFELAADALPQMSMNSKSCIRACDFDNDGDIDLFVGGRVIPGMYPINPKSYLLKNNGKGKFSIVNTIFDNAGMITDAQWADINKDGKMDLVTCGEFMPVKIYLNKSEGFVDKTSDYFSNTENGLWSSIAITDVNKDGNVDIIAGNLGLNTAFHASEQEPLELYYADFDGNGSIDPFFNCYMQGKSYPYVSRDELNEQMYVMRKKFASYKAYADATMQDLFTPEQLANAGKLSASETRTVCFVNNNGKFTKLPLPLQAQFSIVSNILTGDFNKDGNIDLLLLGNHSDNRLKIGSINSNYGCLVTGDSKGNFTYLPQTQSGVCIKGDVKSTIEILVNGLKYIMVGISGGELMTYKEN